MATPSRPCRWPRRLAEAALLPLAVVVMGAHAADVAPSAVPASMIGAAEPTLAGAGGQDVYLDVTLNGAMRGLMHFGDRSRQLWATQASLRQLGFVLPANSPDPVPLASLAGLNVAYDAAQQRVALTAPLAMLRLPETQVSVPGIAAQPASSAPGLLLNYDLFGTWGSGSRKSLSAYTELRAFGQWGVFSNTALSQHTSADGPWQRRNVRLDTNWTRSWPDRMLSLRVGDTLTSSVGWSRATRIGGVQLGSNFALQPYLVTTPVPALLGSATLPSQLDLYVNGMRQFNGQVPAGPFQLNTLPSISGAGNAQVVLTDAFGRATLLNFSLYGSQALLKKGLSSWSAELGRVRRNYGQTSNDYDSNLMLSASGRHGLADTFTVEAHGEASKGVVNAGAGGAWLLPGQAGVLTSSLAHSAGSGLSGSMLNLGYQWSNNRLNFGFNGTRAQAGYRDVAALHDGNLPVRGSGSATVGYNTDHVGSFSLSYVYLNYPGQPASRYASAGWFKPLGRTATLSATVNQDLTDRKRYSAFVSVSWALNARTSASAGLQHDSQGTSVTAAARHTTPNDGGWGWSALTRQGTSQRGGEAEASYLGPYGRYAAGVNVQNSAGYTYGNAAGALVFMDGRPFAARSIHDAFALVSTHGVPDVPVLLENRRVGHTDRNGHLLVTPLNAYQNNQLGIDAMGLPADLRIDRVKAIATPGDRAGTLIPFDIQPVRAALVVLVDTSDQPLPLGSQVRANDRPGSTVVGYDGEVYLDALSDHNQLSVQTPAGVCRVRFDHPEQAKGTIPRIGPLVCSPEARP